MSLFKKKKKNDVEEIKEVDASDSTDIVIKKDEEIKEEEIKSEETEEDNSLEEKEKTREEKRKENGPFKGLGFIFKICGAAVLLAIFIAMTVKFDDAQVMIITVTGTIITLLCLARLIFYFLNRKIYTKTFKTINIIEIILDGCCGLFLMVGGIYFQQHEEEAGKFIDFMKDKYRFFVGAVLWLRGALHFFATAFFKSKSTIFNYFVNLIFVTLGTFCIAYSFTLKQFVIVLIVVIALSCIYLAFDGIRGAIKYWNGGDNNKKSKPKKKKDKKDKKKADEIPAGIIEPETNNQAIVS